MLHHRPPLIDQLRSCCVSAATLIVVLGSAQFAAADEFTEFARVSMRLKLLQETWHRDLVEQDPVQTQIMDARVTGQQTTSVSVRLTAESGTQMAQMYLHSHGSVQSLTAGFTKDARVDSLGSHSFQLTKPVFFDGRRFLTRKAHGSLMASTQPIAVRTAFSGVPLLGTFGDQIAWAETYRRRPVTNSIVVRQVADDVVPQFDSRVETELADANRSWTRTRGQINRLLPQSSIDWQAASTRDSVTLKLGTRERPATYSPSRPLLQTAVRPDPLPGEDLVVSVSEMMVNDLLRGLPVNGLTVTDTTLNRLENVALEDVFANGSLLDTSVLQDTNPDSAVLFSLQFSDETPLQVRFETGHVALILRFRVIPKIGVASDLHRLTLRIKGTDGSGARWAVRVEDIEVTSEGTDPAGSSLTEIIRTQARTMLVDQPPSLIPRLVRLQAETGLPDVHLRDIRSGNGVLRASFQLLKSSAQSVGR